MDLKITNTRETVIEDYHGVSLEIARLGSDEYLTKYRRLMKPHQKMMRAGHSLPVEKQRRIQAEAMAGTVLVGWSNFVYKGETIAFSESVAADLLFNDRDAANFVTDIASTADAFLLDDDEEEELSKKP